MCVSEHVKDRNWMKMWGSKSEQILRCLFIYSFENPFAFLSLFLGQWRSGLLLQSSWPLLTFLMDICRTYFCSWALLAVFAATFVALAAKFSAEKDCSEQLVVSPAACFGASIYWPGNKTGPSLLLHWLQGGKFSCSHTISLLPSPSKTMTFPDSSLQPKASLNGSHLDCVRWRKMSRGDASVSALPGEALSQQWQSNHNICTKNGCRFAAGPLDASHLHE